MSQIIEGWREIPLTIHRTDQLDTNLKKSTYIEEIASSIVSIMNELSNDTWKIFTEWEQGNDEITIGGRVIFFGPADELAPAYAATFPKGNAWASSSYSYYPIFFPLNKEGRLPMFSNYTSLLEDNPFWGSSSASGCANFCIINNGTTSYDRKLCLGYSITDDYILFRFDYSSSTIPYDIISIYNSAIPHFGYCYDINDNKIFFGFDDLINISPSDNYRKHGIALFNGVYEEQIDSWSFTVSLSKDQGRFIWGTGEQNNQQYLIPWTPGGVLLKNFYFYSNLSNVPLGNWARINGHHYKNVIYTSDNNNYYSIWYKWD